MDMVLHSVDYPDGTSHLDKLLVHVVVNRFLFVQMDIEIAVFGGPNSVDPDSNVGVGHGSLFGKVIFCFLDHLKTFPINYWLVMHGGWLLITPLFRGLKPTAISW